MPTSAVVDKVGRVLSNDILKICRSEKPDYFFRVNLPKNIGHKYQRFCINI